MNMRFCVPRVQGRGAGLGNELIPWARAFLAAQLLDARVLPPAFGLNSRRYWRHFGTPRFDWVANRVLQFALPVVEFKEADYLAHGGGDFVAAFRTFANANALHTRSSYVLVTEGMWGGYRHIAAARDFMFSVLYQSRFAARNLLRIYERLNPDKLTVAMHVRLGDFGAAPSDLGAYRGKFNLALPLAWYRSIARSIQQTLGDSVQFLIVSDGSAEQLKPLLDGLDATTTSDIEDSDCSDLLALAKADLLICSVSSFSTTAAFISNAPYVWFEPNLQRHDGRLYSIWGHEPAQQAATGCTQRALQSHLSGSNLENGRGIPIGIAGELPADLLSELLATKRMANISADLVYYGVAPIVDTTAH